MGGDKPCRRFRVLMFPPAFGEHIFLLRSQDWKLPDFRKIAIERYVRPERRNRREALNGSHILKSPWRSQAAFVLFHTLRLLNSSCISAGSGLSNPRLETPRVGKEWVSTVR